MSVNWKELSRAARFQVDGSTIDVKLTADRHQKVNIDDSRTDVIRLWSSVAARRDTVDNATLETWKVNRFRELVGFKVIEYGRVIGESWVPVVGLSADEWKLHVLTLARSADRLEYLWTGRDAE